MGFSRSRCLGRPVISSLGFSGAGFLTCYHLGVAQCLIDHGVIAFDGDGCADDGSSRLNETAFEKPQDAVATSSRSSSSSSSSFIPVCGVSAGSLISAAIAAQVPPREGLDAVIRVSQRARQAGLLNALQPGFSLIDVMEEYLTPILQETDTNAFMKRIEHGKRLRIGLTDTRRLRLGRENAFVYVDSYENMEDVIAACVLSSYVPGVTGPARGSLDSQNSAVFRSMERLEDMVERGCIKDGATNEVITLDGNKSGREFCWDGGIANAFPYYDKKTTIITPLAVDFRYHASINPSIEEEYRSKHKAVRKLPLSSQVRLHLSPVNGVTWKQIVLSPTDDELEWRFDQGYENAATFLETEEARIDAEAEKAAAESGTSATGLSS